MDKSFFHDWGLGILLIGYFFLILTGILERWIRNTNIASFFQLIFYTAILVGWTIFVQLYGFPIMKAGFIAILIVVLTFFLFEKTVNRWVIPKF